jgi:dihydroorotate dehydrogenase
MTLYDRLRPLLFKLPPERAHDLGKTLLEIEQSSGALRSFTRSHYGYRHPMLETEAFGCSFRSPVGTAAGFDKDGEVSNAIADLGFGFTEVGTVTPRPQTGNPRPRLFRLPDDEGMINRLAFNGAGAEWVRTQFDRNGLPDIPVGVNIGKMNASSEEEAIADYRDVLETLRGYPDYFVVNVSCPNTPEDYDEQSPEHLSAVFSALTEAKDAETPLLVKVGPDSPREGLADLVDIVHEYDLDGVIATNTTTDHSGLTSDHAREWGGVSGKPLEPHATETVRALADLTDLPIVGVGGVRDAESAYRKIRAGASLVQLYTGFVYGGPSTARRINRGLVDLLRRDGFDSVEDAVGADR